MISDSDLELILQEIYEHFGYDFSGYSRASLKRRVDRLMQIDNFPTASALIAQIRLSPDYARHLVEEVTVNVTEMFRDPQFYKALRTEVLPLLAPKPFIRIWHAGSSTGEEVFSMAILLAEAGILGKSLIYATDINPSALESARKGIFPMRMMKLYSENYVQSGGKMDFSDFYTAHYSRAQFREDLSKKMLFSQHNLVSDGSFNEFDLIVCRNVLIYFDKDLQNRVLSLFDDSLSMLGFLALGTKESIKFSPIQKKYEQLRQQKIWKKVR